MITILGGSGFIGQHLEKDLKLNYHVENLSLRDMENLAKIQNSDVVINLIGKAHDHKGVATERDYYYANYDLVKEIYDAFVKSNACLFIHVSSIAALEEEGSSNALIEGMDCKPVSWYGKSKRKAEEFLLSQDIPEGKKVIILRPTMVHGPGDKGNLTLLYSIISKGIPNPLAKYDNKRSFLAIDNFNFFVEKIIESYKTMPSGIYHMCDDEAISTSYIISCIGRITDKKVLNLKIPKWLMNGVASVGDFIPLPINTKRLSKLTSDLIVSNNKLKLALNIQKLPFNAIQGLETTIASFRSNKI